MKSENSIDAFLLALIVAPAVVVGILFLFSTSADGSFVDQQDQDPLFKAAADAKTEERVEALLTLATRGEELDRVVPLLAHASINMTGLVQSAGQAGIERLGGAATEHLKPLFDSGERSDYLAACSAMRFIGKDAKQLLPQATKALDGDDRTMKMAGLFALSNMGEEAVPYLPQIRKLLDDDDMNNRIWALRVIESLGPAASDLGKKVLTMMKEDVVSARGRAAIALGAIGLSEEYDVVTELKQKLNAFTQIEKERALIGLGYLGEKAKAAVPEIEELMTTPSRNCTVPAATARWRITGDHQMSVNTLLKRMDNISDRTNAVQELEKFGPLAADAVQPLIDLLKSQDPIVIDNEALRESAIITLGSIGAKAKSAIPVLKDVAQNSKDALMRYSANESIEAIKAATEDQPKK